MPRVHLDDELMRQLAINLIREFEQDVPAGSRVPNRWRTHWWRIWCGILSVAGVRKTITTGGLPPRTLARVIDYVNGTLSEPVTLGAACARVAGISTSHLAATFKRSTGQAPHQFVMAQRLERARSLLIDTRLPIAEVARRCGFADQSHLHGSSAGTPA